MNADSVQDPLRRSDPQTQHEQFAALVSADRAAILESYVRALTAIQSPLIGEARTFTQAMASGSDILSDVIASTLAGSTRIDESYKLLAFTIGESRAQARISPIDSLRAAVVLFEATIRCLAGHVKDDADLLPSFIIAVLALNESITTRVREATVAYTCYLLERIQEEHLCERRRIARDLHDRLGERLSVALRQLELLEIAPKQSPPPSAPRSVIAREALADAMHKLRLVISDLRQDSVINMEKALRQYIDSVASDAEVQLRVSGDETWAPPAVIDEAFLIIREAMRNAFTHGLPRSLLVRIALAPHELRASVDDNGRGFAFVPERHAPSAGNGIASMRERAVLLNGRLTITSVVGEGTHVELVAPLFGRYPDTRH